MAEALLSFHFEQGSEFILHVTGWSMGPTLGPSRDVVVRPLKHGPAFGDVVLLRSESKWLIHRVVGQRMDGQQRLFVTKGDYSRTIDQPVTREEVVGLVVGIKTPEGVSIPCHWRWPYSCLVALLSRIGAGGYSPFVYLLQRILYFSSRAQETWSQCRERKIQKLCRKVVKSE